MEEILSIIQKVYNYLTRPKPYLKEFVWWEPQCDSVAYTHYFAHISITKRRICKRELLSYKGSKIKFDGVVIWDNIEYNLDWFMGINEFTNTGNLELLRKNKSNGEIRLHTKTKEIPVGHEDYIEVRIVKEKSEDKDVGSMHENWKVADIIKNAVKWH